MIFKFRIKDQKYAGHVSVWAAAKTIYNTVIIIKIADNVMDNNIEVAQKCSPYCRTIIRQ